MKYVLNAIRFTRVNRRYWILPDVLINSDANTACNKNRNNVIYWSAASGRYGALIRRFFILLLFPVCVYAAAQDPSDTTSCKNNRVDENVIVKKVIDGDTVILADDRHVRLIGINTPEISHDDRKSEIGADQALDYLSRLLSTNKNLQLQYDKERKDHYGRTLAHLFLHDGTNIQSLLLKFGLATPLTIPPNIDYLDCYQASAEYARNKQIGLWALKQYQAIPVESVNVNDLGYRIITGTVARIGESKSSLWLNLSRNFALRITRDDLAYFDLLTLKELNGKQIIARGWIYFLNGEFRMRIRHPVDLILIKNVSGD